MNVFLIDDSTLVIDRITNLLSEISDVTVIGCASSLKDAINGIQHNAPEVVVLDLQLPDGNGFGLLQFIKKLHPKTRVIVFTNSAYLEYENLCLQSGADYFFNKSTDFEKVLRVLSKMTENQSCR